MERRFWVFDWLEENNITTLSEAAKFLPRYRVIDNLKVRAEAASEEGAESLQKGQFVLAGTGIDFVGGHSICPSPTCMRGQVDELFKRVWHYFDRIVVADVFTPALLDDPPAPRQALIRMFLTHLPPLLYLLEIGAEHLVEFLPKVHCEGHWRKHAEEEGLGEVLKLENDLADRLLETSNFHFRDNSDGESMYWIEQPETTTQTGIPLKRYPNSTEQELQEILANLVIRENLEELTFDVATAHKLKLPLGAIVGLHARMLAASCSPTIADVALRLELPILDGVPTKELVRLTEEEHDSFLQFRDSLGAAIRERIRLAESDSPKSIADQVQKDVIEPALTKIRRRLAASENALAKKTGVAIFLGTLGTTCGILCGVSPILAVPAGSAAVITATNSAAQKHIEEKQAISMEDMYFLWKATEHFH
jgi:hypothetical protein